jgi:protein subunit release factor A
MGSQRRSTDPVGAEKLCPCRKSSLKIWLERENGMEAGTEGAGLFYVIIFFMNEENEFQIEKYLENPRTKFIAEEYQKTLEREEEAKLLAGDPEMAELVRDDIEEILKLRADLKKQLLDIEKKEKEEEEFPNELVLEIRAAAGGDEASLFAAEVAMMYQRYVESKG